MEEEEDVHHMKAAKVTFGGNRRSCDIFS